MKWLFFILLLINIGLFVWMYPQYMEAEPERASSTGSQGLVLLSEAEKPVVQTSEGASAAVEMQARVEQTPEDTPSPEVELQSAGVIAEQGVLEDDGVESKAPVQIGEVDIEAEIIASNSALEQPVVGQELQAETTPEPPIEAEPEIAPPLYCSSLGPIEKRSQADQLSLRLRAFGLQPDLNSEVSNEQQGYWVLVPPQKSRRVAVGIVKRLKEAGVTDLWRFTSGELAHAISLGLFRNETRAELRRKSIEAKGFDAEVRPRYRQKTRYWLSYSYSGDFPVPQENWKILENRYPGIERRIVDCQEIASQ